MTPADQLQTRLLAAWAHPVGTPVMVTKDDGTEVHTVTTSGPGMMGGVAVVRVDGLRGTYALDRVRVVSEWPKPRASDGHDGPVVSPSLPLQLAIVCEVLGKAEARASRLEAAVLAIAASLGPCDQCPRVATCGEDRARRCWEHADEDMHSDDLHAALDATRDALLAALGPGAGA